MKIHTLIRSTGLKDKARQRGRGDSSGRGNYSGKGYKGQKSRTGFSLKPYFEGGQTSVVMRMPKARGFKRYYKLQDIIYPINLCILEKDVNIKDGSEITKELLKTCGYIKKVTNMVKIL
jgi:large subunit ribosomal protein L15